MTPWSPEDDKLCNRQEEHYHHLYFEGGPMDGVHDYTKDGSIRSDRIFASGDHYRLSHVDTTGMMVFRYVQGCQHLHEGADKWEPSDSDKIFLKAVGILTT